MIASFRHGFIHIKTKKTAGTSVEVALGRHCGPDDIVTPVHIRDELLRLRDGKVQARNFTSDKKMERRYRRLVLDRDYPGREKLCEKVKRTGGFVNHVPARFVKERVPAEFWESAVKFTVERHPYEKAVSMAYYRTAQNDRGDFNKYLDRVVQSGDYNDYRRYVIDGKLAVDVILRQEFFESDFLALCRKLGVPVELPLPRAKGGFRRDHRPASEILTAEQKDTIYRKTRSTFRLLGYDR